MLYTWNTDDLSEKGSVSDKMYLVQPNLIKFFIDPETTSKK
jgi:hypothetical protein